MFARIHMGGVTNQNKLKACNFILILLIWKKIIVVFREDTYIVKRYLEDKIFS